MRRDRGVSRDEGAAEDVAIAALTFLAEDSERIGRFLALTGIDPEELRRMVREPGFLAAVLDHVCNDERLLVAFAESAGADPQSVVRAQTRLSGHAWERDVP